MRIQLLILSLLTPVFLYAQDNSKLKQTIDFLRDRGIKINTVRPPRGFKVYYNCDSLLFMRGNFWDTIKIWTPISDMYQSLEEFRETITDQDFGRTEFVKSIDNNGRINVSTYHQTTFIYRNDSLFEIGNANPISATPLKQLLELYFNQHLDEQTYKARIDSIHNIEQKQAIYKPKLIFTRTMFLHTKVVSLPKKVNFEGDTIELERKWTEHGKTCYWVRINNKTESGGETTYAYAFDEDMRFIQWEGCIDQ